VITRSISNYPADWQILRSRWNPQSSAALRVRLEKLSFRFRILKFLYMLVGTAHLTCMFITNETTLKQLFITIKYYNGSTMFRLDV